MDSQIPVDVHPWWLVPLIQGVGQAVTWLIVLRGWYIVNKQNNQRERRKEIRTSTDRLKERIEKLEQIAITFHSSGFDSEKARVILGEIQRISQTAIRTRLLSYEEHKQLTLDLRRSITLDNFDATNHRELLLNNPLLDRIYRSVNNIIEALEDGFSRNYP